MMMLLPLLVLALIACEGDLSPDTGNPFADPTATPLPLTGFNQAPQYSAAQATLAAGQNELMDLSHQATAVSLSEDQAANVAAQATLDYNQRQLMELSIRGTEVSQNMAWAAATQQFIAEQTQAVWNASATAQSQAATATYSAYSLNVTQTAQAQAILAIQATHTAQANATQVAYSLTATPWAAIQSDIVRMRNESERRALWGEFVVTPLKVILITLVVLLLIAGGVLAYQRLMPVLELRLRTIWRNDDSPLLLVDGMVVDLDRSPRLPRSETPQVEIVGPSEPSVTNWITEAEQKLRADDGRIQP
ncbi:MAG: hypothetical protein EHM70_09235 [Chloroflexota bacterium]|nr:MAG: hypothetical protein EHM70_09235 [Chloroflexota bacterium]